MSKKNGNNDLDCKKEIEREKKLSYLIFCYYVDSKDRHEYSSKVISLSDKLHLEKSYLFSLRDIYLEKYASADDKKEFYSKKKSVPKYVSFCEKLFSLKPDKRINYIVSYNISLSNLKEFFKSYKMLNYNNVDKVDMMLDEYTEYLKYSKTSSALEKKTINYNEACAFYQNIIDLGFYSIKSYAEYCGKDKEKILYNHKKYRNSIKCVDISVYDRYLELLEANRKKTFLFIKDKVDKFNSDLKNCFLSGKKYDIIDYYLSVGVPLSSFREVCKDFISSSEMANFSNFSSSYIELETSGFYSSTIFSSVNFVNGREITDDEKSMVYSFLKENDIPLVYFNCALIKYANGELDNYIGCYVKKKNSSF